MHLKDLKDKSPKQLLSQAEELGVEDASSMRVQDLVFAIMKKVAEDDHILYGDGVIEVMQDGFGFLRSSRSNYLASADDIYVSPQQVKNTDCVPEIQLKAKFAHRKKMSVTLH